MPRLRPFRPPRVKPRRPSSILDGNPGFPVQGKPSGALMVQVIWYCYGSTVVQSHMKAVCNFVVQFFVRVSTLSTRVMPPCAPAFSLICTTRCYVITLHADCTSVMLSYHVGCHVILYCYWYNVWARLLCECSCLRYLSVFQRLYCVSPIVSTV